MRLSNLPTWKKCKTIFPVSESLVDCSELLFVNLLPPSYTVRKQKKNNLEDRFSSVLSQNKKYRPYRNLKFNNSGILQSLKLRNFMGKILRISLKLNFTFTLGC